MPHLRARLNWFNDEENSFVIQISDDDEPEISDLSMSPATLTLWNFGTLVRSRKIEYLLKELSTSEKDKVMADLWEQHCDEIMTMEGSYFTINGQRCLFEFVPSADQAWQTGAANEVNQAATYPSMFANVSTTTMDKVNGTLGEDESCT